MALPSIVDKFCRRLGLTDPEKTTLRGDLGAVGILSEILDRLKGALGDSTRIGKEYMPEQVDATVILADTSASMQDAGALGLNSAGQVVVHDGLNNGDDLGALLGASRFASFYGTMTAATVNATDVSFVKLCDLPMSGNEMTSGNFIRVAGRMHYFWDGATKPTGAYFCLAAEGQTPDITNNIGLHFPIQTGVTSEMVDFEFFLSLNASGLNWESGAGALGGGAFIRNNNAGTVTNAMGFGSGDAIGAVIGVSGSPNKMALYLVCYEDTATVAGNAYARGNISLAKIG